MAFKTIEKTSTIEGIFEVTRERVIGENSGGSWTRTLHSTEGVIKRIDEREIVYDSANPPIKKIRQRKELTLL